MLQGSTMIWPCCWLGQMLSGLLLNVSWDSRKCTTYCSDLQKPQLCFVDLLAQTPAQLTIGSTKKGTFLRRKTNVTLLVHDKREAVDVWAEMIICSFLLSVWILSLFVCSSSIICQSTHPYFRPSVRLPTHNLPLIQIKVPCEFWNRMRGLCTSSVYIW